MIKAIIFDFGNVICSFDNNIFLEKISMFTNKSIPELDKLIYRTSDLPKQYETGLITSHEFFEKMAGLCGLNITKSEFTKFYAGIFTPIQTTFGLLKRLKPNYKLGLLSNTNEWDFEYGIKPIEVFHLFDAVSLSFVVKAMKPAKKIFTDALAKLKLTPEECVYIDDIKKYAEVANQIGIHGIHYTSYDALVASLEKLGIRY